MALRVGLLHYTAPPVVGGVEHVIGQHARLLADAGHRVRIVAGRAGWSAPGVEVVRVPLADTRHPLVREHRAALEAGRVPPSFGAVTAELRAALAAAVDGLDVVVAHNVCSLHFNLALTAALHEIVAGGAGPPLVAWHHDVAVTSGRHAGDLHPGYPWDLLRTAWPGVSHVAISDSRRIDVATAIGADPDTIRVVPNGIDVEEFIGISAATRRITSQLKLPAAGPVLLTPARITPRKNLELAIGVVAALRRSGGDARLIVTGPPDPHEARGPGYLARLETLAADLGASDAVHFLARTSRRRPPIRVVADLYRMADALLITSHDEGFGLPILEAAACRLPIVCADLPPLRALAGRDATYFDTGAAADEIAVLIRERLAAEAPSRLATRIRSSYGWPAIYATQIEPLLVEVAASR